MLVGNENMLTMDYALIDWLQISKRGSGLVISSYVLPHQTNLLLCCRDISTPNVHTEIKLTIFIAFPSYNK